jgi:hypothetical protein
MERSLDYARTVPGPILTAYRITFFENDRFLGVYLSLYVIDIVIYRYL